MKEIRINNFKEKLFYEKLDNGLEVFLVPLKNKNNYTCMFGTKYGGRDIKFFVDGKLIETPTGIAHFLEHKMFEKDEDPFHFYQKYGTDVNASTSYDYTAYYILGNKKYEKNLTYLLNWLKDLNLTDQLVQKEKDIILEEASMYKDSPDRVLSEKLKANTFINDAYKNKVIGFDDDIKSITKEQIMCCYNSFYNLKNMFLICTGNIDVSLTMKIVKECTKDYRTNNSKIEKYIADESDKVYKDFEEIFMNVDIPRVGMAFKINKNLFHDLSITSFDLDFYLYSLVNIGFGFTSDIRDKWLNDNLFINSNYRILSTKTHYVLEFYATTYKCEELIKEMERYINDIKIDEDSFSRYKKVWIASEVKSSTNINSIKYSILDDILDYGEFIPNKLERINNLSYNELLKVKDALSFKNKVVVKIKPFSNKI